MPVALGPVAPDLLPLGRPFTLHVLNGNQSHEIDRFTIHHLPVNGTKMFCMMLPPRDVLVRTNEKDTVIKTIVAFANNSELTNTNSYHVVHPTKIIELHISNA